MPTPSPTVILRILGAVAIAAEAIGRLVDRVRGGGRREQRDRSPDPRRTYCRRYHGPTPDRDPCDCRAPDSEHCRIARAARRMEVPRS